jgi:hypothetical protein
VNALKAMTVAKLRGARERKMGKVAGRKSYAEANPDVVKLACELSERRPRLSFARRRPNTASRAVS